MSVADSHGGGYGFRVPRGACHRAARLRAGPLARPRNDGTLPRRKVLHLAAGIAALPATARIARAQTYPARPVKLIVGFPAGGQIDIVARLTAEFLSVPQSGSPR